MKQLGCQLPASLNVLPAQAAKRCAGMGAGKCHVDGVYIIKAGGRQSAWSCPGLAAKHHVDAVFLIRGAGFARARRTLRLPGRGLRRQVPCRRRLHNPQRPQGGRQLLALLTFSCAGVGRRATECVELPRLGRPPSTT